MVWIRVPEPWELPEGAATPEGRYLDRRALLRKLGLASARFGLLGAAACLGQESRPPGNRREEEPRPGYPARRNPSFADAGRRPTPEEKATTYNNFYEFTTDKEAVHRLVDGFVIDPWTLEISGLVDRPRKLDIGELEKLVPLEERVYRFRCVEAWSMTVPWTGLPLARLVEKLGVRKEARFVAFETFHRQAEAPVEARMKEYPWPYHEGLTIEEATNPLTLLATGIYGKPLPRQNGAPLRLVVPWKYGLKNIKSLVRLHFTDRRPGSFWNRVSPREYDWFSNVDPSVPHPRWSQETERLIDDGRRINTLLYNGYGEFVAELYRK